MRRVPDPYLADVDDEPAGAKAGNVIDLMAALKKSAGSGKSATTKSTAAKAKPKKAAASKRKSA